MCTKSTACLALGVTLLCRTLGAQQHTHPRSTSEQLGTVRFATSCAPRVTAPFNRAVALLHSFEFGPAIRAFEEVLAADTTCAMAWWGIALSRWSNPMTPSIRPPAVLALGRAAVQSAQRVSASATPRERAFISAVSVLFAEGPAGDQAARVRAYAGAMSDVARAHPTDVEAQVFYALALVGAASPTDKTYANQLKAGAMLQELFSARPDHPGLAHYIIHAYDVPALAGRADAAARRYADIAPAAAHALHMPSHTFTRVGLWNESVQSNLRSMEAALRDSSLAEVFHAADYAVYAYLQMRRDSLARGILDRLPALAQRFDPSVVAGAAPGSAGVFALNAVPARWALERRAWGEAAALPARPSSFPFADAITWFARALGSARAGDTLGARRAIDTLEVLRLRLAGSGEVYWAEQVAIQGLGATAWLHLAAGRGDDALRTMRQAAAREDATEKAAVTPGPLAPARELLGEMLLELGRSSEALIEFRAALTREPNRRHTLEGGARAAEQSGDAAGAARFREQIVALSRR